MMEIRTCSASLLYPGDCCVSGCPRPATEAALTKDLVEHTRCSIHVADCEATKPLRWDAAWGPR